MNARHLTRVLSAAIAVAISGLAVTAGSASAQGGDCQGWIPPNTLVLTAGSPQQGQIGKPFLTNLQVQLANTNGCQLTGTWAGVSVLFTAPASGAGGTFASTASNVADVGTDANGAATAPAFTANRTPGDYEIVASSSYGSVVLYLTNTAAGVAASIAATGSDSQSVTVGGRYQPLQARVLDMNGQPVSGTSVTFQLEAGETGAGASFTTGGSQASVTTDQNGIATSPALAANASPGRFAATAATDGVASATFELRNLAPRLTAVARTETATVGDRYRRPLRARVLDTHGRPVVGVTVTFALPQAAAGAGAAFVGGTNQATATTNGRGAAESPPMIANDSPGRFDATATTGGVVAPVTFQLRNLAPRLTTVAEAETATVDERYPRPLQARALDSRGRPVEGITVTFTLPQTATGADAAFLGGGTQATATTDARGRASSPALVANGSAGRFNAAATIAARPTPITFALRNVAGAPATVAAGAASGESTATGSRFPIRLAVTVTDKNGNPIHGALVTFTAPTGGGPSGYFTIASTRQRAHASHVARVRTNADGVAVAPPFTANTRAGGYAVTARVGTTKAGFALVNTQR